MLWRLSVEVNPVPFIPSNLLLVELTWADVANGIEIVLLEIACKLSVALLNGDEEVPPSISDACA